MNSGVENLFNKFIADQINFESITCIESRKRNGVFMTNNLSIVDQIIDVISFDRDLFDKTILEPACGNGIFLLRILYKAYQLTSQKDDIDYFIKNGLFFCDIDANLVKTTCQNLQLLYKQLTGFDYVGYFNAYTLDFTAKPNLFSCTKNESPNLYDMYGKFDYVIGNPPYVTLYGRRDKKQNERQRAYYLENYKQFPITLKNGKINYVMLFIEHSLDFLKIDGKLGFIVDVSFFETPYKHIRKHLIKNTTIESLTYNIVGFDVASGQLILKLSKELPNNGVVRITDDKTKHSYCIKQNQWNDATDEYKFRISICQRSDEIVGKILNNYDKSLKELYPHKNLRTCTMLLDMENKFVFNHKSNRGMSCYPYYKGSKSLKTKFGALVTDKYFHYDKCLQDDINNRLRKQLAELGIKNKKRLGLGEKVVYDNPKVYIRQSAKSIIATYDENPSAANNSLYVFSLRSNNENDNNFLRFICGYLNSELVTFFAQNRKIIRYSIGKHPQIKISDLYNIPVPDSVKLWYAISQLVHKIYESTIDYTEATDQINNLIYEYYSLNQDEISSIKKSIQAF